MKVLREWRKICFPNQSLLRKISLCQDSEGLWLAFTEVSPEGPDQIVYLPLTTMVFVADVLASVADRDDRRYAFVPCVVYGKDYWRKPARLNGVAYTYVLCRYRHVLVFNGPRGIWTVQFVSGRHAKLVVRLLRMVCQRYGATPAPDQGPPILR